MGGIPMSTTVAVGLSFLFSFVTFTNAHVQGISGHRDYTPLKSKAILAGSVFFSAGIRVTALIMFFAPSLGLFDLLRHYQAEMIGFRKQDPTRYGGIEFPSDVYIKGNLSEIQRGSYQYFSLYEDPSYIPPTIFMYTMVNLKTYFVVFWIILF